MKQEFLNPGRSAWNPPEESSLLNDINFVEENKKLSAEEEQKKYRRVKLR